MLGSLSGTGCILICVFLRCLDRGKHNLLWFTSGTECDFMSLWKPCVYFLSQIVCRKDDVKDWRKPQLWCADRAHGQDAILWDASWCILRQFGCPAYYRGEYQLPVVSYPCSEFIPYFQGIMRDEGTASCIYSLDTRCKRVNSFTPYRFTPWERGQKNLWMGDWVVLSQYGISENACEHFDFETFGANIDNRSHQTATNRKDQDMGRKLCRLVIFESGLTLRRIRNGYAKKGQWVNLMSDYLYRCTVHSVVYLINTPTNAHIFI